MVFYILKAVEKTIDRSRWLDRNLEGVNPANVEFQAPPCTARKSCPEVMMLQRLRVIKNMVSKGVYGKLLDKCSSLFDLFQYILPNDDSDAEIVAEIPPLRARIAEPLPSTSQTRLPEKSNI